jgi:sterol desaturase/sphingolipid hydroxylase (fatty acid hydroxylase superfamily)
MDLPHQLHNVPTFLITWMTFVAAGIVTFALQMHFNREKLSFLALLHHMFPFDAWMSKSVRMDIKIYVIRTIVDKLFVGLQLVCTLAISDQVGRGLLLIFPDHVATPPTYLLLVGSAIVIFIVAEFSDFLTHYLNHVVPVLWELHKVHHSAMFLNPLTAKRGHPLDYIFGRATSGILCGVPVGIFTFAFGLSLVDILFLAACVGKLSTITTLDALRHSHFPISLGWLDRVFISPHMHQVHHSSLRHHWDTNFGTNLSIWDWMFGTAYRPTKGEAIRYGLGTDEERDYERLYGAFVSPLTKMWNLVRQRKLGSPASDSDTA